MRLTYTFFFFITMLVSTIHADAQEFRGGIIAGIAGTQVLGDGYSGPNKPGICVGPYVNLSLTNKSSVQMQLEFMQKGSRENPDSTNNFSSYLLRLSYVQVPIMYQYRHSDKLGFEVGGSYGVLVGSYEEGYAANGQFYTGSAFEDRDVSFHAAMHYSINEKLKAEFEFSHSLLYIRPEPSRPTWFFNQGEFNHVLLVAIQYQIDNIFGN